MTTGYLVADIGGTNARFAIARGSAATGFKLEQIQRLRNEDFEHLRDAALAYLQICEGPLPRKACFAVAAPVAPGAFRLTNAAWKFDAEALVQELNLDIMVPVNDFAAQARGAPLCPPEDQFILNEGKPDPTSPIAVLGPGTGLGLGLLIPTGDRIRVVPTEGGHAGFAPRTEEEIAVGKFIADEHGYVSWERLLSGRGMVNIHRALCALDGVPWTGARPQDITAEALDDPASLSRRVVNLFCDVLGAYAGDVGVLTGARGGIYLAGGIAPKILPILKESRFEARRVRRGPMTRYAEAMPVRLIMSDAAALMGAAAIAEAGGL